MPNAIPEKPITVKHHSNEFEIRLLADAKTAVAGVTYWFREDLESRFGRDITDAEWARCVDVQSMDLTSTWDELDEIAMLAGVAE